MNTIHKLVIPTPFAVGAVNVYLVEGDVLTLVDAGPKTEEAWQSLQEQLQSLGYRPSDIEQVVLTHHHGDHAGLLDYLRDATEFRLGGHPNNQRWIQQSDEFVQFRDQFYHELYKGFGVPTEHAERLRKRRGAQKNYQCDTSLDYTLQEGDQVPGLEEWTVYDMLGHAQSQIVLYREKDGVMLGGDHLIGHISSNALIEPPASEKQERPKTLLQYRHSLERCLAMEISQVLSGHGKPVDEPAALIQKRLKKQDKRANKIQEVLEKQPMTVYQLCEVLFPLVYKEQLGLTLSEALGHLDLLEAWDIIEKERMENGADLYSVKNK